MSQNPNGGANDAAQGRQGQQSQQGTARGQQTQDAQQGSGQGTPPQQNQPSRRQTPRSTTEEVGGWFTETIVRAGILVIGVAVMLFAIGQAVGANLVEPLAEFFTSGTGAWFVVAFIALLVMVAATKSWRTVN